MRALIIISLFILSNSPLLKAQISTYPYTENFDNFSICNSFCNNNICNTAFTTANWTNLQNTDDDDWEVQTGSTPSNNTGPSSDHTGGNGRYLYTEASGCNDNIAIVETPSFFLDGNTLTMPALEFWYHMYGATMGNLAIQINNGNGYETIWQRTGSQGNQWRKAVIPLQCYLNDTVAFRIIGTLGSGLASDMAIDDFSVGDFSSGADIAVLDVLAPTQSGCDALTANESVTVYLKNAGATPISNAILNVFVNNTLTIADTLAFAIPICSDTIYTLAMTLDLSAIQTYEIKIAAQIPNDIDTFNNQLTITVENPGAPVQTYPYHETFDLFANCTQSCLDDECLLPTTSGWKNPIGDTDDWEVRDFSTGSAFTGPSFDHTNGNGKYLFTESSGCNNKTFFVESPCFDLWPVTAPKVSFWYHMYGAAMGKMTLQADSTGTGQWTDLWTLSGNQGDIWHKATVPLYGYFGKTVKFRMKAETGSSFTSDMAFDDFKIEELPQFDVRVENLISPNSVKCDFLTTNETVQFSFKNIGADTVFQTEHVLYLDDVLIVIDTLSQTLFPNQLDTHTFSLPLDLALPNNYQLQIISKALPQDGNASNDTLTKLILNEGIVQNFPALETFDGFSLCQQGCLNAVCDTAFTTVGWTNLPIGDDTDWNIANGFVPNPNGATGATSDHTSGTGNFLMLDADFCNGIAIAETPCYDLNLVNHPQVSFWYHMFGATMGTLLLQIDTSGMGNFQTIWTLSGNQGNQWRQAKISLAAFDNKIVRFRIIGNTNGLFNTSNMAIDDFLVKELFNYDGQPTALISPVDSNCSMTSTEIISIKIANVGNDTLTNPTLTLWINDVFQQSETFSAIIPPDTAIVLTFSNTVDLSFPIAYDLKIASYFANEQFFENDTAIYSIGLAPITNYPSLETFDNFQLCNGSCFDNTCTNVFTTAGWKNINENTEDSDWSVVQGASPSFGTGPFSDHTSGFGNYLLADSWMCNDAVLTFQTPCYDLTTLAVPSLVFWYHMRGNEVGDLTLEIDDGSGWTMIWSKSGSQSNQWLPANISLLNYTNSTVRFRMIAQIDDGFASDMAIDDWYIGEAPPHDIQPLTLLSPQINGCTPLTNNEQVAFSFKNNGANTADTVIASLVVNNIPIVTDTLLGSFLAGGIYTHTFSQTVNLSAVLPFQIDVTATVTGDAFTVNDLMTVIGENDGFSLIQSFPYSENFDGWDLCVDNFCTNGSCAGSSIITTQGWKNITTNADDADWSIQTSSTSSANTGPTNDHTTGFGKYIYTEATNCFEKNHLLQTPCFDFTNLYAPEVSFWYHMFGSDMGTLELQADTTGLDNWETVWSISGNQGVNWQEAKVNLQSYVGTISKFRFKGLTGDNFQSDMAIDDFGVKDIVPHDLQIVAVDSLQTGCGDDSLYLTVILYNAGFNDENDYAVSLAMTGAATQTYSQQFTTPFLSETYDTLTFGFFNTSDGGVLTFTTTIQLNNATDLLPINNTNIQQIIASPLSEVVAENDSACGANSFQLGVTGDATEYFWYSSFDENDYFHTGTTYSTPFLNKTETYWVEGRKPYFTTIGMPDTAMGGAAGNYYGWALDGLEFDAHFDLTMDSLTVYPQLINGATAENLTVNIKNENDSIIGTTTVTITENKPTTIFLGTNIPIGNNYKIDAAGTSPNILLYRSEGGAPYPFVEPNTMTITNPINFLAGHYYFFYDIHIKYLGCPSPRVPVTAAVLDTVFQMSTASTLTNGNDGTITVSVDSGGVSPFTYAWNTNPVQTNATATDLPAGIYTVTVTDAFGCLDTISASVFSVGTNHLNTVQKFNIYPNPTDGQFVIDLELSESQEVQIEVLNSIGQRVFIFDKKRVQSLSETMNIEEMTAGLYWIRLKIGDESLVKAVVKK